ncbi:eye-specific diacylglycerol kinase-like isoform X2 [Limulus polyphemus]|uniref:Diacylglycerol kinase n=1 Tax=Limulus polyphemus TaxID=6850 RepID=A0ABM1SD95_LIMPO|nr:eye-specific diacylglycerol kinase-like isoform X2 [Limulus polyphemus]
MQKIRDTFKKVKNPNMDAPEANLATHLEVPKQVRSASYGEIHCKNHEEDSELPSSLLNVPNSRGQRSRSFDLVTMEARRTEDITTLDVPRWRIRRRSSSDKSQHSNPCFHCLCLEEYYRSNNSGSSSSLDQSFYLDSSSEHIEENYVLSHTEDPTSSETLEFQACSVLVTPSSPSSDDVKTKELPDEESDMAVVSLEVPPPSKQVRSASVDSSFLKVPCPDGDEEEEDEHGHKTHRSRSIDIGLPTGGYTRYTVHTNSKKNLKKAIQGEIKISTENGETRTVHSTPDWGETAINGDHLWVATSASGDLCYVGENDCSKQGPRMKCPACKITAHTSCISILIEKKFYCKPTFKDVGIRQYREQTVIHHHWVHRRQQKGRCKQCGKAFQSKLSFASKEIVGISCSWCKTAYHNKEQCFNMQKLEEHCTLGIHTDIIVPPSWIVKLPRKGSFKSSLRRSPKKRGSTKRKTKKENEKEQPRTFAIKPIPSATSKPLIVFINPKSGGNQGSKLMHKFQWLLNPRQVFDLTLGGPSAGLELYRKVPNLRILACGGDGTAGWVLSVLDEIGISPSPPVAVLPLGTGNDLARALGWGGGYTDEPISKILSNIQAGDVVQLDRWDLQVEKNLDVDTAGCEEGKDNLPLNVVNNYFSLGVDAHIALEFHEAREARPDKFNSRLKNKMFYGQAGGKDLLQRKWKDLCNFVTLECDGQDLTPRLKELRIHAILFLNIPSYGGGTRPWISPGAGFELQRTDDGLIEILGLTTYQLPLLQAGGHGTCLAQCRHARIVTTRTIPMQVDGEPCKILPSIIELRLRNKASMVAKAKRHGDVQSMPTLEKLTVEVRRLSMTEYETYHYDKEKLNEISVPVGKLCVDPDTYLEQIRARINELLEQTSGTTPDDEPLTENSMCPEWCFLDSCTAERFFRIDRAQENLYYMVDICADELFILYPEDTSLVESNGQDSTECLENDASTVALNGSEQSSTPSPSGRDETLFPMLPDEHEGSALEKSSEDVIIASKTGDLPLLKQLQQCGYSLLSIDQYGMTALHHAARYGHKDIVRHLIANASPAMLDMVDNEKGQTALHKAAAYKRRTVCYLLVSAGASLTKVDKQGMTPKQLAMKAGDDALASYLENQQHFQMLIRDKETAV